MDHLDAYCVTGSSPTGGDTSTIQSPPAAKDPLPPSLDRRIDLPQNRFLVCRITGPDDAPLIIVLGGISAGRKVAEEPGVAGWWSTLVGPGRAIDTRRLRVIGVDYLGGLGASWRPRPGDPIAAQDQAAAIVGALEGLGITGPVPVIGASYGGVVALALGALAPSRCRHLVIIAAAHRSHPLTSGLRDIQRRIVRLGRDADRGADGVALARSLAMATYRTAKEFETRFSDGGDAARYLEARGRSFAKVCDPETYLTLSASLDASVVDPGAIDIPTTIIGVPSDTLVPPALIEELSGTLSGPVDLHWLDSRHGHDAFLKEPEALTAILRPVLDAVVVKASSSAGPEIRTRVVRAGVGTDGSAGAVMPPIHLSANYVFPGIGSEPEYDYTRSGNPTRDLLAEALADLEGGAGAVVTASGLGAATLVLSTLPVGSRVVAPRDCYGGTRRLLDAFAGRGALRVSYEDLWTEEGLSCAGRTGPALLWIETPSNPLLRVTDIAKACAVARTCGARTLVDNTFLSPVLQRPLAIGADLALHSTTKLLNGHSDVVGGAVVASDPDIAAELRWWSNCLGVPGSPFDSYLTLRGLRTLHPRLESAQANAAAIVEVLAGHPAVAHVFYPGLVGHSGHETACRQQSGFGSLVSFELRGGEAAARTVVGALRHFTLAESLGGVESLVCHPATMTHAAISPEARMEAGINGAQIRLSLGIESPEDLVRDLTRALASITNPSSERRQPAARAEAASAVSGSDAPTPTPATGRGS